VKRCLIVFLSSLFACIAHADYVAYGGTHELSARNGKFTVRHVHNWSSKKVRSLFLDLGYHDHFLSKANDFAFIELRTTADKLIFRSQAPALTDLWISPDYEFVVGLSDIKLYNPYQLVVWRRDGTLLHCEHISSSVAKLSADQEKEFARRFSEAEALLRPRRFTVNGTVYIDFSLLGVPNTIGDEAWNYLSKLRVPHPYSNDFRESVTNSVFWFNPEKPNIRLEKKGASWVLYLNSPSDHLMEIPLGRR